MLDCDTPFRPVSLSHKPLLFRTLSQLKRIARAMYSNPPVHGARIVAEVVNQENMFDEWKAEMEMMSGRIMGVRKQLHDELGVLYPEKDWGFILSQIGMFSYTGIAQASPMFMSSSDAFGFWSLIATDVATAKLPLRHFTVTF